MIPSIRWNELKSAFATSSYEEEKNVSILSISLCIYLFGISTSKIHFFPMDAIKLLSFLIRAPYICQNLADIL
jgi:hypothetical protein